MPISVAGISRFFFVPISLSIDFDVATASISSVVCNAFFIRSYIVVRARTELSVGLFISQMRIFVVLIRCGAPNDNNADQK